MKTNRCENCKYFVQHYVEVHLSNKTRMDKCFSGHCTYPRCKDRKPSDSCINFKLNVDTHIRLIKETVLKQVQEGCREVNSTDFYKRIYTNGDIKNLVVDQIDVEDLLKELEIYNEQNN